jgi:hypothetical protein
MSEAFLERRREPRVPVTDDQRVGIPLAATVRLMDISASGVLISSSQRLTVGQRARLHTTLGSDPFNAEVEVCRVAEAGRDGSGRGSYRIGASFTRLDEAATRSMNHFLSGEIA